MDAKVISVKANVDQTVVTVGFYSADELKGEKVYYLNAGQTVDDIKPDIKQDLQSYEETHKQSQVIDGYKDEPIELEDVKTREELNIEEAEAKKKAEEDAKAKEAAEAAPAEVVAEPTEEGALDTQ